MSTVFIAVTFDTGIVGRMQFEPVKPVFTLSPASAKGEGYVLSEDKMFWSREITDDYVNRTIARTKWHPDDGTPVSWRRVAATDFPVQHHEFRRAWRDSGGTSIGVDMPKARDIWRERMRAARAPLLKALDVEMTRALRDPVKQDEIEAKRQALRDMTSDPAIEAAQTPAALKLIWPAVLTETPA